MKFVVVLVAFCTYASICFAQNFNHALTLYSQKDYDEAFKVFNAFAKGNKHFAESRYHMALISMAKKDFSKAEDYLEQALEVNNEVAKYHVAMVNALGNIITKANKFSQATMAPTLRNHMEEAIRLNPMDMNTPLMLIGYYMQAPGFMGGGSDKAIALANSIIKRSKADGYRALGLIAHFEKKYPEAEENYQKALNHSPDSTKFYYSLAQVFQSQSKYDQMIGVYEKAMVRFPENKNLLLQAGRSLAYADQKYGDKGVAYLNEYIKAKDPVTEKAVGDAYYYLGLIEKNRKNLSLAKDHFNSALKVNPDHSLAKQELKE